MIVAMKSVFRCEIMLCSFSYTDEVPSEMLVLT